MCYELVLVGIKDLSRQFLKIFLPETVESLSGNDCIWIVGQIPDWFLELITKTQDWGDFVVFCLKRETTRSFNVFRAYNDFIRSLDPLENWSANKQVNKKQEHKTNMGQNQFCILKRVPKLELEQVLPLWSFHVVWLAYRCLLHHQTVT